MIDEAAGRRLNQPVRVRVTNSIGWWVLAAVSLYMATLGGPAWLIIGCVLAVAGIYLAVRQLTAGVDLRSDEMVVHGATRTKRINRDAVSAVTRFPRLDVEQHDKSVELIVTPFLSGRSRKSDARQAEARDEVERWWAGTTPRQY
ncbi:hypothetical protein ACLBWP_14260 [Microbacterium sp. M1A1_1b]